MSKIAVVCAMIVIVPLAAVAGSAEDRTTVVRGNTRFALDLFHRLRSDEGNLFLSPLSLSAAFGMTSAGARSHTAEEIAEVLHFDLEPPRLHRELGDLLRKLEASETGYRLHVANAIWPQVGDPFLPEFVTLCAESYGAGVEALNFENRSEAARRTINRWVSERTEERIPELLEPGNVTPATAIVLTNAVYFKGEWLRGFDASFTRPAPFTLADGTIVEHPLMRQSGSFGYFADADLQVLELPYAGEELSMVVVLPRHHDGLRPVEEQLSAERLGEWIENLEEVELRVALPSFSTATRLELGETLRAMGMSSAFGRGADFSGMNGARDLWIDIVVHETFVELSEEGTEAAAATAVAMKKGLAAMEFRADHPFLYLIRDRQSGSILFLGRLADPTG